MGNLRMCVRERQTDRWREGENRCTRVSAELTTCVDCVREQEVIPVASSLSAWPGQEGRSPELIKTGPRTWGWKDRAGGPFVLGLFIQMAPNLDFGPSNEIMDTA